MKVFTRKISLTSEGSFFSRNITEVVREIIKESSVQEGMALVFYQHTTGTIIVGEHEAGMLVDLEKLLESIIPVGNDYKHHLRGYDTNGAAHLRTAIMNMSVTLPITEGNLDIGRYQEILVIDFDDQIKQRTVVVKLLGA